MDIFAELEKLRMKHHENDWYTCPKHPSYEYGDKSGECNCGADDHNETLDGVIEWLETHRITY